MRYWLPLLLVYCTPHALAEVPAFWPLAPLPPGEARILKATSTLERELAQIDALAEAEAWNEAVDGMMRLIGDSSDKLIPVTDDFFLPLATACQLQMSDWPEAGLSAYRAQVDSSAKQLLEQAIDRHDLQLLQQVIDRYFASGAGDEALLTMADLSLQSGNLQRARSCLLQISPWLSASDGRPWGIVLAGRSLDSDSVRLLVSQHSATTKRPADMLVYPDSEVPVAHLMARLAVISIRERNFARAKRELAVLQAVYPEAQGKLGGRETNLAEAVAATLAAARDWPVTATIVGDRSHTKTTLGDLSYVEWQCKLPAPPVRVATPPTQFWFDGNFPSVGSPLPAEPAFIKPLVGDGAVVFQTTGTSADRDGWFALDSNTGKPLFGKTGQLIEGNSNPQPTTNRQALQFPNGLQPAPVLLGEARVVVQFGINNGALLRGNAIGGGRPPWQANLNIGAEPQATINGHVLYAVVRPGEEDFASPNTAFKPQQLLALDLEAEGKLQLEISPSRGFEFVTTPLVRGQFIFLVEQQIEQGGLITICCHARGSGRLIWRSEVFALSGEGAAIGTDALIGMEDKLLLVSQGVVVAVRADTGRLLWGRRYQRGRSTAPGDLSLVATRRRGDAIASDGALVCAPADASSMFALAAETGRILWVNSEPWDIEHFLGTSNGKLVAEGHRIWVLDSNTGNVDFCWPELLDGDTVVRGRSCLAGKEVFYSTNDAIHVLNISNGQPSRNPIPLDGLASVGGATLTPCGGGLLVSTDRKLTLLGSNPPRSQPRNSSPPKLGTHRETRPLLVVE